MRRRADVATSPSCCVTAASSAVAPLRAIVRGVRFALPRGQRVGPSSPMVHAVIRVDALDMTDLQRFGTWRTAGTKLGALALATFAVGIAACGEDKDKATAAEAANPTPRAVARDLGRYLMRRDEEPGFRPGAAPGATPRERETITGVKALVNAWHLTAADERRLSREGFIAFAAQPIRGPRSAGVTN